MEQGHLGFRRDGGAHPGPDIPGEERGDGESVGGGAGERPQSERSLPAVVVRLQGRDEVG